MKRAAAIGGIVLLLSLYLISFISAILAKPYANGMFMASIFCTIAVPILMYGFMVVYKYVHKEDKDGVSIRNLRKQNKDYMKQEKKKKAQSKK